MINIQIAYQITSKSNNEIGRELKTKLLLACLYKMTLIRSVVNLKQEKSYPNLDSLKKVE